MSCIQDFADILLSVYAGKTGCSIKVQLKVLPEYLIRELSLSLDSIGIIQGRKKQYLFYFVGHQLLKDIPITLSSLVNC